MLKPLYFLFHYLPSYRLNSGYIFLSLSNLFFNYFCIMVYVAIFLLTASKTINIHKNKLINYFLSAILCLIGLFIFIKSIYEYF